MSTAQALTLRLFSCRLTTSSSTSLESRDLEGKMAAAVEQERYAFSRRSGYDTCTYGGCQSGFPHSGFPTAVELQIQPAAAVLGAGVPGAALARTRVVPVASPGGSRSSSVPGWSCRDSGPSSNFRAQSSTTQNRKYWEPIGALMVEAVISLVKALVIQMEAAYSGRSSQDPSQSSDVPCRRYLSPGSKPQGRGSKLQWSGSGVGAVAMRDAAGWCQWEWRPRQRRDCT